MKKPLAGIINISTNNILSIRRALEYVGFDTFIIDEYKNIEKFDLVVLPGVGAFKEAMKKLIDTNLIKSIEQALEKNKNFLGICLGMQLLFEKSEEFGLTKGIAFFNGDVENFNKHNVEKEIFIGWNRVSFITRKKLIKEKSVENDLSNSAFYFVHSYFANPNEKNLTLASYDFGGHQIPSIVAKDNIIGCQFHPEKSGNFGLNLIKNFISL